MGVVIKKSGGKGGIEPIQFSGSTDEKNASSKFGGAIGTGKGLSIWGTLEPGVLGGTKNLDRRGREKKRGDGGQDAPGIGLGIIEREKLHLPGITKGAGHSFNFIGNKTEEGQRKEQ